MDLIRHKIAEIMRGAIRKAIEDLDPVSAHAKALQHVNIEAMLGSDVERICKALSFFEATRALALITQLDNAKPEKVKSIKQELKKIAEAVALRAEAKGKKLTIPDCCRDALFEL
jgi:hypothetical protein